MGQIGSKALVCHNWEDCDTSYFVQFDTARIDYTKYYDYKWKRPQIQLLWGQKNTKTKASSCPA